MSAWAYEAPLPADTQAPTRATPKPAASLPLRLAAFFGFSAFAWLQFATLLLHPPAVRVLAAAAAATVLAGTTALCGSLPVRARVRSLVAAILTVTSTAVGLLAIGVPAHLLLPQHWGALARDLHRGYDGLSGWLWPYRDGHTWARLAVLAVLPPAGALAGAISFWPSERGAGVRRIAGLVPLIAVFLAGVVNEVAPLWRFQGVVLLALIFAWLALPTLRAQDVNRAIRWLLGCTALALATAPLLSAQRPWIDYAGWDPLPASTVFQWDQLYGPNTWSRSTATMFEVTELHPRLLRVTTLDRFDGLRFLRSNAPPGSARLDQPGGRHAGQWYDRATITLGQLRSSLLVGAGGVPIEVMALGTGSPVGVQRREADGTVVTGSPPAQGARYAVLSYAPQPSAAAMRRAPRRFPASYLPYTQLQLPGRGASALRTPNLRAAARAGIAASAVVGAPAPGRTPASDAATVLRIEGSPYAPAFALARRLAAGAGSPYDVALRVERFLRGSYTYSLDPPRSRYPLESFLFEDRIGYCQQFSGAMTLLLRMDGIPARVAVGFKPGVYDPVAQRWRVRALDAHAWVEVYFSGIGWVAFDPTPPAPAPHAQLTLQPKAVTLGLRGGSATGGGAAKTVTVSGSRAGATGDGDSIGWLALLAIVGAGLLALAAGVSWTRGTRRLRRGLSGDGDGAVRELQRALGRLGHGIAAGTTLAQLQARLERDGRAEAARYVALLRNLRYAGGSYPAPTLADRRRLRRALAGRGLTGRVRALLALPPGATLRGRRRFCDIDANRSRR